MTFQEKYQNLETRLEEYEKDRINKISRSRDNSSNDVETSIKSKRQVIK